MLSENIGCILDCARPITKSYAPGTWCSRSLGETQCPQDRIRRKQPRRSGFGNSGGLLLRERAHVVHQLPRHLARNAVAFADHFALPFYDEVEDLAIGHSR